VVLELGRVLGTTACCKISRRAERDDAQFSETAGFEPGVRQLTNPHSEIVATLIHVDFAVGGREPDFDLRVTR
jgi:hypothetical protein